jgi:hypothetical protein
MMIGLLRQLRSSALGRRNAPLNSIGQIIGWWSLAMTARERAPERAPERADEKRMRNFDSASGAVRA